MKPELVVAPKDLGELKVLAESGADAFIIGSSKLMMCGRGSFEREAVAAAVKLAHGLGKKVYLTMDAIMPNQLLGEAELYLNEVKHLKFDGVRYGDLGVYLLLRAIVPQMPLHFVDQMMLTNYKTINYWFKRGVGRVKLAPELTLDEVIEIKKEITGEAEILIHGAQLMFTSRRRLVENYFNFQKRMGQKIEMAPHGNCLWDAERERYYPIVENTHGTHIFSGNDVCMIDELQVLIEAGIEAFYLEGFVYETKTFVEMVALYRLALDLAVHDKKRYRQISPAMYAEVEKQQQGLRPLDRGFYYKPTIYKNK